MSVIPRHSPPRFTGSILRGRACSLILVLFSLTLSALAQDIVPSYDLRLAGSGQETYLELDEAIAAALRSNLDIQIEAIAPQLEEDRTLQAIGEFDPAFESRFRYDNLDTPQTSQEFVGTGGDRFANGNLVTRNRVFAEENFEGKVGIIGRLRSEWGFTIVMIEHDMGVVRDVSDRVVVLDHGEPIAQGSYEEVSTDPQVIEAYLGRPVEGAAS